MKNVSYMIQLVSDITKFFVLRKVHYLPSVDYIEMNLSLNGRFLFCSDYLFFNVRFLLARTTSSRVLSMRVTRSHKGV